MELIMTLTRKDIIEMYHSVHKAVIHFLCDGGDAGAPVPVKDIIDVAIAMPTESETLKKANRRAWSIAFYALKLDFKQGTHHFDWFTSMDVFDDGSVTLKVTAPDGSETEQNFKANLNHQGDIN